LRAWLGGQRAEEQRLLAETKMTQEKTSEALKKLEWELEREWEEFERLEESANGQIADLTQKLKHLKKVTLLTLKYQQHTATAKQETLARMRKNRLDSLRLAIQKAKNDHKTDKRVHKRSIAFLNKQKEHMDQLADEWEKKYQGDFTEKTNELNDLTQHREQDQQLLIDKQQRWEEDKSRKIALMEEMKRRENEDIARNQLLQLQNLAQCKIRFAWRVYWRKRKKVLKKLYRRHLQKLRAKKKALAQKYPMLAMQQKQGKGKGKSDDEDASPPDSAK